MNWNVTDELKLTSITEWDQGSWNTNEDDDGTPINVDEAQYTSKVNSFQEELALATSFDGPYNFISARSTIRNRSSSTTIRSGPGIRTRFSRPRSMAATISASSPNSGPATSRPRSIRSASTMRAISTTRSRSHRTLRSRWVRAIRPTRGCTELPGRSNWLDPTTHLLTPEIFTVNNVPNLTTTTIKWIGKAGATITLRRITWSMPIGAWVSAAAL